MLGVRSLLVALLAVLAAPSAALAATVNPGDILVADWNAFAGFNGGVIRVDPATGAQATVASGGSFVNPSGIALAENGDLLVADQDAFGGGGGVIRVDPATGAQTVVASGGSFVDPTGIALAPNGDVLVADLRAFGGSGGVIRVNPVTGAQATVASGGSFVNPSGIALAANGDIFVADIHAFGGPGGIIRVNPIFGTQATVASGGSFVDPFGIALAANGDILVADQNAFAGAGGGVIRVDPATGAQATVASGGSFVDLVGIALAANGDILVVDASAFGGGGGGVIRVNPATGAQATVASGGSFFDPVGIALARFLSYQAPASASPNNLVLRRNGSMLELRNNGVVVASGPLAYTDSAVVAGADGTNDTLMIDYRGGFFSLPGGIQFGAGTGTDRIDVLRANGDYTLTNGALAGPGLDVTLTGVEQGGITAGVGNDTLDASGFSGPTALAGGAGNDLILGGAGNDGINGNAGDDEIDGGAGNDTLYGSTGHDTISDPSGTNQLWGHAGDDELIGGADNDLLVGGAGDNVINGGFGTNSLNEYGDTDYTLASGTLRGIGYDTFGNVDQVTLAGGESGNTFTVNGYYGTASLIGGFGITDKVVATNDANFTLTNTTLTRSLGGTFTLSGIEGASLTGGLGANTLDASAFTLGEVTLAGGAGHDVLKGGGADDVLVGGSGNDNLTGKSGDDLLDGGTGTDRLIESGNVNFTLTSTSLLGVGEDVLASFERATLNGSTGANTIDARAFGGPVLLFGGGGADVIHGTPFADALTGGPGGDTLKAYEGNDTINAADGEVDNIDGGLGSDTCNCDPADVKTGFP